MATIRKTVTDMFSHPGFIYAVNQFQNKSPKDLEIILMNLCFHIMEVQQRKSGHVFAVNNKNGMNASDIKKLLVNLDPPENLNLLISLPNPNGITSQTLAVDIPENDCVVIPIRRKGIKTDPCQLSLWDELYKVAQ